MTAAILNLCAVTAWVLFVVRLWSRVAPEPEQTTKQGADKLYVGGQEFGDATQSDGAISGPAPSYSPKSRAVPLRLVKTNRGVQ